jgi:hypothetical protein
MHTNNLSIRAHSGYVSPENHALGPYCGMPERTHLRPVSICYRLTRAYQKHPSLGGSQRDIHFRTRLGGIVLEFHGDLGLPPDQQRACRR